MPIAYRAEQANDEDGVPEARAWTKNQPGSRDQPWARPTDLSKSNSPAVTVSLIRPPTEHCSPLYSPAARFV